MPANEILAVGMFISFIALVFTGFPVAWLLGGLAIVFSALAVILEADFQLVTGMNWDYTSLTVERIWNVMENWVMVALPMFILMGLLLDRSGIANQLMSSFARLFGNLRGGLAITVTVIGLLLAFIRRQLKLLGDDRRRRQRRGGDQLRLDRDAARARQRARRRHRGSH